MNEYKKKLFDVLSDTTYGICSAPMSADVALQILTVYLLEEGFYIAMPVSQEQANTEIVAAILEKHSKEYRKDRRKFVAEEERRCGVMVCKDCISFSRCKEMYEAFGVSIDLENSAVCKHFKNKADFVEVQHAKWEINCDGYYPYCSNCKTEPKNGVMSKRCPECGAKMDGRK